MFSYNKTDFKLSRGHILSHLSYSHLGLCLNADIQIDNSSHNGHIQSERNIYLSDSPGDEERCVLGVWQHALRGVEEAEVSGTVDDDALHGHAEATV